MKVHFKKLISTILAVALVISMMVVPVGASGTSSVAVDGSDYIHIADPMHGRLWMDTFNVILCSLAQQFGIMLTPDYVESFLTTAVFEYVDECYSMEQLQKQVNYYNTSVWSIARRAFDGGDALGTSAIVKLDEELGIYRPYDTLLGTWATDWNGCFPFLRAKYVTGDKPSFYDPTVTNANKWIDVKNLDLNKVTLDFLAEPEFTEALHNLQVTGVDCTAQKASFLGAYYWVIMKQVGTSAAYYCNPAGQPYVMMAQASVTNNPFDYIVDDGVIADSAQILDAIDGVFNLLDELGNSIPFELGDLSFDPSVGTYTANVYNTIDVGGIYIYNYYTYNVTYNITNTYITYIGSNDAYEKEEYQFYYQLPDGRSSADLTADEVAGMSFEFYDVVNYVKSATDISVRALYHFDGNTDDSSYFSTQGSFNWGDGASITYMEAPSAFDGALYLDNIAHNFVVALPSNIGSGDFQIQFRHYQASELDTLDNVENKLIFGDVVLSWDESSLYLNGTRVSSLPIGTWHEIGLSRYNGHVYAYLNGLLVGSVASSSYSFSFMTFEFGSTSRAYTMLDELRVLNVCLFKGAGSYSPAVVPFDSNLVLVLPDERLPIADSYMQVTPDPNAIAFWDWSSLSFGSSISDDFAVYGSSANNRFTSGKWNYSSGDVVSTSGGVAIDTGDFYQPTASNYVVYMTTGVALPMSGLLSNNTDYTVTVVLTDGSSLSHTFNSKNICFNKIGTDAEAVFHSLWATHSSNDVLKISSGLIRTGIYNNNYGRVAHTSVIVLTPAVSGGTFDISHVEIVQGTKTDLKIEEITSVFSGIDLHPNTAAVQSAIPVKGYTVGGVRPTLPSRGDVWFPVSENRIQSCYIYTGSMWEEVGCRWYTGSRWIPIYAFDINTLQDLFDVADGSSAIPPLTSENAFIRWWQLQWLDFRSWLENALSNIGTGGSSSSVTKEEIIVILPGDSGSLEGDTGDDSWTFVDLLSSVKDGAWKITKGIVGVGAGGVVGIVSMIVDVGDFFDAYDESNSDNIWGVVNYGGADIWD